MKKERHDTADGTVTTVIDQEKCIGCGRCVRVCPSQTLSLRDKKACVTGDRSIACGHCQAVCPTGAARVGALDERMLRFQRFPLDRNWLPPGEGEIDTARLVRLMASRRSCRNYLPKPVDRDLLSDLVKIGALAPSGSNCQLWRFTVLSEPEALRHLGDGVLRFFARLNRLSGQAWLRNLLRLSGRRELYDYFHNYADRVQEAIDEWRKDGRDRLFYRAPAAILVGSRIDASCAREDALLATQNILLGAHSMGLGTCLIGFAVEAMRRDRSIRRLMEIPEDEQVYAVILVGYPDETYREVAGRKTAAPRFWPS